MQGIHSTLVAYSRHVQTTLSTLGGERQVSQATFQNALGALRGAVRRHGLTRGAWVDVRPGWVSGSDELFARLVTEVSWQAERRTITAISGNKITLEPGAIARLHAGQHTIWTVTETLRKIYVLLPAR